MTLDLAARADLHPRLYLGERADPRVGPDLALVEVGEGSDDRAGSEGAVSDLPVGSVVGGLGGHGGTISGGEAREHLRATIAALERWGAEREWIGPDPYEGLNARRAVLRPLRSSALGRRLLIQAVKRSPLDLRRPLGITPEVDAASLAHVLRAYARLPGELGGAEAAIDATADRLLGLRCRAFDEPCWGYHFDVETRFFHYGRGTPNTIATGFAGHALLEASEAGAADPAERERRLRVAVGAGRFFLRRIGLVGAAEGGYFGYFPGDRTPIHNASLLAASLLARLAARGVEGGEEMAAAARAAVNFALAHQRPDGSWPYAEGERGDWVDGFHTGYVLDALATCEQALADPRIGSARERGLAFYRDRLLGPDGAPRFFADATYPIDGQSAAQAIRSFALAAGHNARRLEPAWRAYGYATRELRRDDGAFAFQRRRLWRDPTPHVRWVQAPMLEALSVLWEASR